MKIVILVDQLHSHGGIEKLVAIKANYWTSVFGYEVTIVSTEQEEQPIIHQLNDEVKFLDLKINFNRNTSYFGLTNLQKLIKNIYLLQKYITKQQPDFILVASHIPITYVLPFLLRGNSKIIKEFHFTKFYDFATGIKNSILNYIESKYNFLVVLSQEEQQFYPSSNTVVIPNPIENNLHTTPIKISQRQNIAIAIVRFAPVKGLEKMVTIWDKFCTINSSWKLHIFGTIGNEYYNTIFKLVKEKNREDFIIFKGQTNAVANELLQSKVLLMTSEQECFPLVVLEAHAAGVPVVSYDCPTGPRNIVHHEKDGFLVEPNNDLSFVDYLQRLATDEKLLEQMSKNAFNNAAKYKLDGVMHQWKTKIFNR